MLEFINNLPIPVKFIIYVIVFTLGTFMLVKCCNLFVDGASNLAKRLNISPLVIGLTVVAIGTSFPELAVSVSDSISSLVNGGNANIAISNVIGSNIANLLVVLSAGAIITPIIVKKEIIKRNYSFLLLVTFLFIIFGIFFGINTILGDYSILRIEAIILVLFIPLYIFLLIHFAKKDKLNNEEETIDNVNIKDMSLLKAILYTIFGAIGVALGGEFVVYAAKSSALEIATLVNLDRNLAESLIGLTIVAIGTSLPEVVTSITASKKGENELALGNVIGSNIFNIIFVVGISGAIAPLTSDSYVLIDLLVLAFVTILVFFISLKGKIKRRDSILLLSLYLAYIVYLILRTIVF